MAAYVLHKSYICITQIVLYMDKQNIRDAMVAKQVMEKRLEVEVIVQSAD